MPRLTLGDVVILRRLASVEADIELTSTISSIDISSNRKPFTLKVCVTLRARNAVDYATLHSKIYIGLDSKYVLLTN